MSIQLYVHEENPVRVSVATVPAAAIAACCGKRPVCPRVFQQLCEILWTLAKRGQLTDGGVVSFRAQTSGRLEILRHVHCFVDFVRFFEKGGIAVGITTTSRELLSDASGYGVMIT